MRSKALERLSRRLLITLLGAGHRSAALAMLLILPLFSGCVSPQIPELCANQVLLYAALCLLGAADVLSPSAVSILGPLP